MRLTFAVRWKPENTLLLQRWALPGPCYIKEQDHSVQEDFAEPCIPALWYPQCCCPQTLWSHFTSPLYRYFSRGQCHTW